MDKKTIENRVKNRLKALGLSEKEAEKAVNDRRGAIDAMHVNEGLASEDIGDAIWSELVYPYDD